MTEVRWDFYPHVAAHPLAHQWITLLTHLQKAPKTIDAYARCLDDLLVFLTTHQLPLLEATCGDIALYVNDLHVRITPRGQRFTSATIHQRLTVARLWYEHLIMQHARSDEINPVGRGSYRAGRAIAAPGERGLLPRVKRQPWIPSDHEWDCFLDVVVQTTSLRNQAMVFLAYDGALRRSELLGLHLADIDWPHDMVTVRPEIAKNAAGRRVFYSEATRDLLVSYLRQRQQLLMATQQRSPAALFLSESHRNRGSGLSIEMWNKIIQQLAKRAALPLLTTHTLRHLRLTDFARCKLELYEIALLAGHRNIESTRLYIHLSGSELGERVKQATAQITERLKRTVQKAQEHHD